jgi:hypothetical protein
MNRVVYKDLGLAQITKAIESSGQLRVRVGVVGPKAEESHGDGRLTNAEAGLINEFGTKDGHVPRRSFLRDPISHAQPQVFQLMTEMIRSVVEDGASAESAADKLGEKLAAISRRAVADGVPPANAPATIKQKGFDHPLIDAGQLAAVITHQVVRADGSLLEAGASGEDYESFEISTHDDYYESFEISGGG